MCVVENNIMLNALKRSNFITQQIAKQLFMFNDDLGRVVGIDDVAEGTGISAAHLRDIFFSGVPMTLQDFLILSDFAELAPLDELDFNRID